MTSAAVAGPVERPEHEGASGRPTVEKRTAGNAVGGEAVGAATTDLGDPRPALDTLADREGAK